MGKGSNTTSTSSTSSADPQAAALYRDILTRAQGVASTPYQAYTGELTAANNSQQNLGVAGINANAGYASPYISQAAQQATQYSAPISGSDISNYLNPYTQNVVDATTAQLQHDFGQQNAQLQGNQIAQGALGGNATGVARAILAGQQGRQLASTTSDLYRQGYQQAVDAAQRQQQTGLAGANAIANYGISGQNAALQGASAQFGVGTQQQQTEQARLDALYRQYAQQQAYPYQQTQWLAGLGTGVGSNLGGTSSGTTTGPQPNQTAQWLGAGLTAASMFLNRGGAVHGGGVVPHMAAGGSGGISGTPWADAQGWIPQINIHGGSGAPHASAPSLPSSSGSSFDPSKMASGVAGLSQGDWRNDWGGAKAAFDAGDPMSGAAWGGGSFMGGDAYGGSGIAPLPGLSADDYALDYASGGGVAGPRMHFADGGAPNFADRFDASRPYRDERRELMFRDRAEPVVDAISSGDFDPQGANGMIPGGGVQDFRGTPGMQAANAGVIPMPRSRPEEAPVVAEDDDPAELPPNETPTQGGPQGVAGPPPMYQPPGAPEPRRGFGLGLISPNAKTGLLTAGLGMLASRSPFLGNAIGEGGLAGVSAYGSAEEHDRKVAAEAEKLSREANQTAYERWMGERKQGEIERHNKVAEQKTGAERIPMGMRLNSKGELENIPGYEKAMMAQVKSKQTGSTMDDETAEFLANRVLAGDTKALVGLGRGAQGAENLAKINGIVARLAKEGAPVNDAARQILENAAQQQGLIAAERTQAQIMAKLSVYGRTAFKATNIALRASDEVARTQWVPVNKALLAFKEGTGDPKVVAFGQALDTLTNEYARAIGSGHGTIHDKERAERRLNRAQTPEQLKATIEIMRMEILAEEGAMPEAREHIRNIYNPRSGAGDHSIAGEFGKKPPNGPVSGASDSSGLVEGRTGTKGGRPVIVKGGRLIYQDTGEAAQ